MEFEFDKEIDAILRKARGTQVAPSSSAHLGADEISAFAENALPERARNLSTAHLADCTPCRKILSDLILLNSEAELEAAASIVPAEIAESKTPWYRKLFVFPQIAYTMGALVILFSGFFGYLVLQNLKSGKSEVSFSTDKPAQMEKSAPQPAPNGSLSSNTAAANSSAPAANAPAAASSTPLSPSNTSTGNVPTERKSAEPESNAPIIAAKPGTVLDEKTTTDKVDEVDLAKVRTENEVTQPNAGGAAIREDSKPRDKNKKEVTSKDDQRMSDEETAPKLKATRSAPENPKKQNSEAGTTRSINGKTFNNVGGIWFDSSYKKQPRIDVNRGTQDYQKLDSGLRAIADQFSGTVVVVWKTRAYQIQ